jgi:hypothetical protein
MSETHQSIDQDLAAWLGKQPMFFVATAPLSATGHINASPKGGDSFRVLGPKEVAYQDYTGSGAETAAHLIENGRIVIMFCAFDGSPRILRLHGRGKVIRAGDARFPEMAEHFPPHPATRAFIHVVIRRIATSCGHGVPIMDFRERRGLLEKWANSKGPDGLEQYRAAKNRSSLDGLPAFGQ